MTNKKTLLDGLADAQRELLDVEADLLHQIVERLVFLDRRIDAVEKRVYKLEEVCREILQRTAREPGVVPAEKRQADGEQLPPDHYSEGGAFETGDGLRVPAGGGAPVKRNA